MNIAVLSDIHAGLGANDVGLRSLQAAAVERTVRFLDDKHIDLLVLNGDTTDHLANGLASATDKETALRILSPLTEMVNKRRDAMKTILLAGNTDWPVADPDEEKREVFFAYTGLPKEHVSIAPGGLLHVEEADDASIVLTHGHALNPVQWGYEGGMTPEMYEMLWRALRSPGRKFLEDISAVSGSHRSDYLKAVAVGSVVKPMPRPIREAAMGFFGKKHTAKYERHCAGMLASLSKHTHKKMLGVMGHSHVAGVRRYDDMTVLNTGTAGAKPNPLQRLGDPKAHMAIIDTEIGTYTLTQTFNAARPSAKPERVHRGDFSGL